MKMICEGLSAAPLCSPPPPRETGCCLLLLGNQNRSVESRSSSVIFRAAAPPSEPSRGVGTPSRLLRCVSPPPAVEGLPSPSRPPRTPFSEKMLWSLDETASETSPTTSPSPHAANPAAVGAKRPGSVARLLPSRRAAPARYALATDRIPRRRIRRRRANHRGLLCDTAASPRRRLAPDAPPPQLRRSESPSSELWLLPPPRAASRAPPQLPPKTRRSSYRSHRMPHRPTDTPP